MDIVAMLKKVKYMYKNQQYVLQINDFFYLPGNPVEICGFFVVILCDAQ